MTSIAAGGGADAVLGGIQQEDKWLLSPEQLINYHLSLPDLCQCSCAEASPVTIKGKGAMLLLLLDHTCIRRSWLSTLEEVQSRGRKVIRLSPKLTGLTDGGRMWISLVFVVT
ncbi:hypothetical protein EPR50_G00145850 [Perca flavescens]|uniref:Uncharacterized protein n=1 Tax=Perca flavescens TaxID=8167 RepID=A0A484CJE5_PERFV|nr:hypothetical protein EPR50_G00145850 [Perca flavescens]